MRYRVILQQRSYRVIEIEPGDGISRAELVRVAAQAWKAEGYQPDFRGDPSVLSIEELEDHREPQP